MHEPSEGQKGNFEKDNPYAKANCFSKATFGWTIPIFKLGNKRNINELDVPKPLDAHNSAKLGDKLQNLWEKEMKYAKSHDKMPSLKKVIVKCIYKEMLWLGALIGFNEIFIRMHVPFLIGFIIRYFVNSNKENHNPDGPPKYLARIYYYTSTTQCAITKIEVTVYAVCLLLILLITVMVLHPYLFFCMHAGMKVRIGCCSLMYRKALRLSFKILNGEMVGKIVNLMSNDVNRFDVAPVFIHYIWIGPLQAIISTILMYKYLMVKEAAVIGMTVIFVMVPIHILLGYGSMKFRRKTAIKTDARVRQMNEIINGIQVIKMYAWEDAFAENIHSLRRAECKELRKANYIRGFMMSCMMFVTRAATGVTILYHITVNKGTLEIEHIMVIIIFYQILSNTMTICFTQGVTQLAESLASISRIREFLLQEEKDIGKPKIFYDTSANQSSQQPGVFVSDVTADFEVNGVKQNCLKNVNLEVHPGELTGIIGQVGSGKSSLLNLILGELPPTKGTVVVNGSISFASQEPWLFAATVRQNILFGAEYNRAKYRQVCTVCALNRDFKLLPYADHTTIGDRGISLSGGQRARVGLARAVYKEADVYLLDDPLSAVDPNVGNSLFFDCIVGYLKAKTVILVTHQLQYIQHVTQVVIMEDGRIVGKGTYEALKSSGLNFALLLPEPKPIDDQEHEIIKMQKMIREASKKSMASASGKLLLPEIEVSHELSVVYGEDPNVVKEMRSEGKVGCKVYKGYFGAAGRCFAISVLLLFLLTQISATGVDVFLTTWAKNEAPSSKHSSEVMDDMGSEGCIALYSFLIVFTCVIAISRSTAMYNFCMKVSVRLHDKMFNSICKATMYFYDTNDAGRILNRFSRDLGSIDEILPNTMLDFFQIFLNLVAASLLACIFFPYLLVPTIIMCIAFYFIRRYYLATSRCVKRLDGILRSPVIGHVTASLAGVPTVRSHNAEKELILEFDKLQDAHSGSWFMFIGTTRAFGYVLDIICAFYIGINAICLVLVAGEDSGANIGLVISQIFGLMGLFQWGIKQSAELENNMTSVERVLEFTTIEQESRLEDPQHRSPPGWPTKGKIDFHHTYLSYSLVKPPVLKDVNFTIYPQEKVGIIGRTGAGKSSLIAALFQLAPCDGQILIDNIDITSIGLHDLRRKIAIIPQNPVIFSGTLRYNLDPFNEYGNSVLIYALNVVEFKLEGNEPLNQELYEGGINLSAGQRQLLCLARAIVRNNIILVLDEATANIDQQTDKFIQTTIRSKFSGCTVLTIAHRLHTIMDSDEIIVMDAGTNVEMGHPYTLMQNPQGFLSKMVEKTGPSTSSLLMEIARKSYEEKEAHLATIAAEEISKDQLEEKDIVDTLVEKDTSDEELYDDVNEDEDEESHQGAEVFRG